MSLWTSKATTSAGWRPDMPGISTIVSCSPATTWAAVTTRLLAANQPLPSTPIPQAVPRILTTRVEAAWIAGSPRTEALGGCEGAAGPVIDGNGSIRASRCRSVRGGTTELRRLTKLDDCTSWRSRVCPGTSSATEAATQTNASPVAAPSTSPPSESSMPQRRQPQPAADERAGEAREALEQERAHDRAGEPGERRPRRAGAAVEQVRRDPRARVGPEREPGEREGAEHEPAPHPAEPGEDDDPERHPVDGRRRHRG